MSEVPLYNPERSSTLQNAWSQPPSPLVISLSLALSLHLVPASESCAVFSEGHWPPACTTGEQPPCSRTVPRALGWSLRKGLFPMSKVPVCLFPDRPPPRCINEKRALYAPRAKSRT